MSAELDEIVKNSNGLFYFDKNGQPRVRILKKNPYGLFNRPDLWIKWIENYENTRSNSKS